VSHLARAGLALGVFIIAFAFLRSASSTVSVEVIGISHKDNPREWAMRPVVNQAPAACAECHETVNVSLSSSAHVAVGCEDCHGTTKAHIEKARNSEEAPLALADARDLCVTCHAKMSSRPADFPQVEVAIHAAPEDGIRTSCTSCHNPHDPGIPPEITHPLEGRSDCLACHGPDEWKPLPVSHAGVTVGDCLKCHSPKEGP